ncbi:MAG: hypothetical protein R3B90_18025 [Planctomycetaceae bacterium]
MSIPQGSSSYPQQCCGLTGPLFIPTWREFLMNAMRCLICVAWLSSIACGEDLEVAPGPTAEADTATGPLPDAPRHWHSRIDDARRESLSVLQFCRGKLLHCPKDQAPGLQVWCDQLERQVAGINPDLDPDLWPAIDLDQLQTLNPDFWTAFYEVHPNDWVWLFAQAELNGIQGHFDRAEIMLILAGQHPVSDQVRQLLANRVNEYRAATLASREVIRLGVSLHDAGEYDRAMAAYQVAIDLWPQSALAYFEMSYSLRSKIVAEPGTGPEAGLPLDNPDVVAGMDLARKLNPVAAMGYQGDIRRWLPTEAGVPLSSEQIATAVTLPKSLEERWQAIASKWPQPASNEELASFAQVAVQIGQHHLALHTQQALVGRRGYSPDDFKVFQQLLPLVAKGEAAERIPARLGGKEPLIVVRPELATIPEAAPEETKEPPAGEAADAVKPQNP